MRSRPDVLVLGAGGVLGLEWTMGFLAGIEDSTGFDLRDCEYFVGTSAGSIAAARLLGGRRPRRPPDTAPAPKSTEGVADAQEEDQLEERARVGAAALAAARRAGEWSLAMGSPLAPVALSLARPGGTLLRAGVLTRIPTPHRRLDDLRARVERYGARFDGRLRIACVDRSSGSHTLAAMGRRLARSAVSVEALALRRRGAIVRTVAPDTESSAAMGGDFMDPEPRPRVLAAGYAQGLREGSDIGRP